MSNAKSLPRNKCSNEVFSVLRRWATTDRVMAMVVVAASASVLSLTCCIITIEFLLSLISNLIRKEPLGPCNNRQGRNRAWSGDWLSADGRNEYDRSFCGRWSPPFERVFARNQTKVSIFDNFVPLLMFMARNEIVDSMHRVCVRFAVHY